MILSESVALDRLNSEENLVNRFSLTPTKDNVTVMPLGRGGKESGFKNFPQYTRNLIAVMTRSGQMNQVEAAAAFGTSQQNVSKIENGLTKSVDEKAVESLLAPIRDVALERLQASLGLITDDKLANCKAIDLSNIASNLSRVVDKTLPRTREGGTNVQVVVFSPETRREENYRSIEV